MSGVEPTRHDVDDTDADFRAGVAVISDMPAGRARSLIAQGLTVGVVTVGDVLGTPAADLQQLLEAAVVDGRLREPRPIRRAKPGACERRGENPQEVAAYLWQLPEELRLPAAAALGQDLLDFEGLQVLQHDELRDQLRAAFRDGRLRNLLHEEDPHPTFEWAL